MSGIGFAGHLAPLTLVLLLAPLALAEPPATIPTSAPVGIDAPLWERMKSIDAKAAAIADLTATFEQEKFTPLLKKPLVSKGTVIARGSVMLWDTRVPEPTIMRVDAAEVAIYYPNQKVVELYPLAGQLGAISSSPVPRLAELLQHFKFAAGSAKDLDEREDPRRLAFRLMPTDREIQDHVDNVSVLIDIDRGFIVVFQLIDADGDRTVIRFSDVKVNTKVDEARLRLTLPTDVKVVRPLENLSPKPPEGARSK